MIPGLSAVVLHEPETHAHYGYLGVIPSGIFCTLEVWSFTGHISFNLSDSDHLGHMQTPRLCHLNLSGFGSKTSMKVAAKRGRCRMPSSSVRMFPFSNIILRLTGNQSFPSGNILDLVDQDVMHPFCLQYGVDLRLKSIKIRLLHLQVQIEVADPFVGYTFGTEGADILLEHSGFSGAPHFCEAFAVPGRSFDAERMSR